MPAAPIEPRRPPRGGRARTSAEQRAAAASRVLDAEASIAEVASSFGVEPSTVRRWVRAAVAARAAHEAAVEARQGPAPPAPVPEEPVPEEPHPKDGMSRGPAPPRTIPSGPAPPAAAAPEPIAAESTPPVPTSPERRVPEPIEPAGPEGLPTVERGARA